MAGEITLISSDNRRFGIPSAGAALSAVIARKLGGATEVVLEKHDGRTLELVAEFLRGCGGAGGVTEDVKRRFSSEFLPSSIPMEVLLATAMAARELEIEGMSDVVCQKIAEGIQNKSVDWVRNAFGIENRLPEAEEDKVKAMHPFAFQGVDQD